MTQSHLVLLLCCRNRETEPQRGSVTSLSQKEFGDKASREKGLLCLCFGPLSDTNIMSLKIILHGRKA